MVMRTAKSIQAYNFSQPMREELLWLCRNARPRRLRSILEFAEKEIIIPDGEFEGFKFKADRQPFAKLWFETIDNPPAGINRFFATGPTQTGKTLDCFVIPIMYHLFEVQETVVCGLPDMNMVADKWNVDLLPIIQRSKYRNLLPDTGRGARGGKAQIRAIHFKNGTVLRFMGGRGSDKSRAAFTARVIVLTEVDDFARIAGGSEEADPAAQIEVRALSYGTRKVVYGECTLSSVMGRTHQEVTRGYVEPDTDIEVPYHMKTTSRIILQCPHCKEWSTPERENLVGYKEAKSLSEAKRITSVQCPKCAKPWTEKQRHEANHNCRLLYRGQSIKKSGKITGDLPDTDTLGFRWNAVNNLFPDSINQVITYEFNALFSENEEAEKRKLHQFVWAIPTKPDMMDTVTLKRDRIIKRQRDYPRGVVPEDTYCLTFTIDLRNTEAHCLAVAWTKDAACHVVHYEIVHVPSRDMGVEMAFDHTLNEIADNIVEPGFPIGDADSKERYVPEQVWIDAGYQGKSQGNYPVYDFIQSRTIDGTGNDDRYRPVIGRGEGQQYAVRYGMPKSTGAIVKFIGQEYHISLLDHYAVHLVETNADYWKVWAQQRMAVPMISDLIYRHDPSVPGAFTMYRDMPINHAHFVNQLLAERQRTEYVPGKGEVTVMERIHQLNHFLDTFHMACCCANFLDVRLQTQQAPIEEEQTVIETNRTTADGRPYFIHQRQNQ
ncbi:MAG: phage terminase large subunit family protein [Phycisphaeraceae bacterium]|nr:phage terminase large subunit family protein [Phycisphaeraceae bacterium]